MVFELSLKLYHAGELQLGHQQLMTEAPDEKGKLLKTVCIAAGYHAEGNASSLLVISMTSSFCTVRLPKLPGRRSHQGRPL